MLSKVNVQNALIFVADSLRYDYLPQNVAQLGQSVRTAASTLSSPGSFSSIVSGIHACRHNVFWWPDKLLAPSVFDLNGVETSFWDDDISLPRVLNHPPKTPLADIRPPFIYFERDLSPHMPYCLAPGIDTRQYFRRRGTSVERIRADYIVAVEGSVNKFLERRATLENRGLLNDTLLIYTSDHGELLGEYGLVGHNSPACPELVYVPTVFCHPTMTQKTLSEDALISRCDRFPTDLQEQTTSRERWSAGIDQADRYF